MKSSHNKCMTTLSTWTPISALSNSKVAKSLLKNLIFHPEDIQHLQVYHILPTDLKNALLFSSKNLTVTLASNCGYAGFTVFTLQRRWRPFSYFWEFIFINYHLSFLLFFSLFFLTICAWDSELE